MHCHKLKLADVDGALKDSALKALLAQNWEVVAFVPVDDNGEPTLMLFLQKRTKEFSNGKYYLTIIMLLSLLLSTQIAQIYGV